MKLSNFSDYLLRILIYVSVSEQPITISRISTTYKISKNHLRKIVHMLSNNGYIETSQGRYGGIKLKKTPEEIKIGDLIRKSENLKLVECFNNETNTCPLNGICILKKALYQAQESFIETLNKYTLRDLIDNQQLKTFFNTLQT